MELFWFIILFRLIYYICLLIKLVPDQAVLEIIEKSFKICTHLPAIPPQKPDALNYTGMLKCYNLLITLVLRCSPLLVNNNLKEYTSNFSKKINNIVCSIKAK